MVDSRIRQSSFFMLLAAAWAGELAFVDVSSDEKIDLRSLDVAVSYARGLDNFRESDPMNSHDWADLRLLRKVLNSTMGLSRGRSGAAKLERLEEAIKPTFLTLPKNEHGRLSNATARYALHRFFTKQHGWSLKGLEPAGGSWKGVLDIDPTVRQLSKYMVPTVLIDMLMELSGGAGLDVKLLAIYVASMEHLVRSEKIEFLYKCYKTLQLPIAGQRTPQEAKDILRAFLVVHAFGVSLDVSVLEDLRKAGLHLDRHHAGWRNLQGLIDASLRDEGESSMGLDFDGLFRVAMRMTERYGSWQGQDCTKAKTEFSALVQYGEGRVSLDDWQIAIQKAARRPLPTPLNDFGIVDRSEPGRPLLIVSNYLNSKAMCLTTASYYYVCCRNECEGLMDQLTAVGAPTATTEAIVRLLGEADRRLTDPAIAGLRDVASQHAGEVQLHSRAFAQWMHRTFPSECPAPSDVGASIVATGPKTPNEWLATQGAVQDINDMAAQVGDVLRRYEALGMETNPLPQDDGEADGGLVEDVLKLQDPPIEDPVRRTLRWPLAVLRFGSLSVLLVSLLGALAAAIRLGTGKEGDIDCKSNV